jgi:hypothetical protein
VNFRVIVSEDVATFINTRVTVTIVSFIGFNYNHISYWLCLFVYIILKGYMELLPFLDLRASSVHPRFEFWRVIVLFTWKLQSTMLYKHRLRFILPTQLLFQARMVLLYSLWILLSEGNSWHCARRIVIGIIFNEHLDAFMLYFNFGNLFITLVRT